jgi:hypothetical protein
MLAVWPPWFPVNVATAYLGGVSPKTVYAMVAAGMRVVRLSDSEPHRNSRGRLVQGRILFCAQWIDEFLQARASCAPLCEREAAAGKSLAAQPEAERSAAPIATRLQRATEFAAVADDDPEAVHNRSTRP